MEHLTINITFLLATQIGLPQYSGVYQKLQRVHTSRTRVSVEYTTAMAIMAMTAVLVGITTAEAERMKTQSSGISTKQLAYTVALQEKILLIVQLICTSKLSTKEIMQSLYGGTCL